MNELMQTVAENLKRNGFEVYTVATADEAKVQALSLIQPDWNVGVGGSMTIRQLGLVEELEELLGYVRRILGAEVKEVPLEEIRLLGLDSAGLRYTSHHVKEEIGIDHPVPNCGMGRICVLLNRLRTQVRACELSAVTAFMREDGTCGRKDIVEALNRLSSCVYILFCRKAAGYYEREKIR